MQILQTKKIFYYKNILTLDTDKLKFCNLIQNQPIILKLS